jgi:hypothetical protein
MGAPHDANPNDAKFDFPVVAHSNFSLSFLVTLSSEHTIHVLDAFSRLLRNTESEAFRVAVKDFPVQAGTLFVFHQERQTLLPDIGSDVGKGARIV